MNTVIIILLAVLIILAGVNIFLILASRRDDNDSSDRDMLKYIGENINNGQREIGELQNKRLSAINSEIHHMNDSFSRRLEGVYKSIGEIQSINNDVGDLKKILSNVKTRGILGEMQLRSILEEVLSASQYEENCRPVPNSRNVVEFAIKLPGRDDRPVYLPIDAKFPGTVYHDLCDAYDTGDSDEIDEKRKILISRLTKEASDIHNKYISPPYTTDFAIMFLPFEGLYIEAVNRGMVEILMRKYNISIAGPSTMAALLNSLLVGFNTIAVEKKAAEARRIISEIKTEFEKFDDVLSTAKKHADMLASDLEKLKTTRTNTIMKSLRSIEND